MITIVRGCLLACLFTLVSPIIVIKLLTVSQTVETFTVTFSTPFASIPTFAYFIESGRMIANQFAITHDQILTTVTTTTITIAFNIHVGSMTGTDKIIVTLMVTDQNGGMFSIGVLPLDVANSKLQFQGFTRNLPNRLSIYPLLLPMTYTTIENSTTIANNQIYISTSKTPSATLYTQGKAYFSYLYITTAFSSLRVGTLFPDVNQTYYGYLVSYARFTFTPSTQNTMLAIKTYDTSSNPFLKLTSYKDFTSAGTAIDQFIIGYTNVAGVTYMADLLMINSTLACGQSEYLYYYHFFQTLPRACYPCHPTCLSCFVPDATVSNQTNAQSCLSCGHLRYLNSTDGVHGTCPCYTGLSEVNNICQSCQLGCLTFNVVYIQSTNQTNFILYYSYPQIDQEIPLLDNMDVYINNIKTSYEANQKRDAIYQLVVPLSELQVCQQAPCEILFMMKYPQKVMTSDRLKSLSHNNVSMVIEDYVNYYTIVPQELQQAFRVLGLVVAGAYGAGFTTLVKMLFEMQQLIDFHKYINLTMPVIFNQLVQGLSSFKFLDLTILLPDASVQQLKNFPPQDLDQMGPPKLMYYQQGVNYIKNIIAGLLSCLFMLAVNYCVYFLLKITPLKVTQKLAKKINKRKIITIHDTFQQMVLPIFFFAGTQLFYILVKPQLSWIYCFAGGSATAVLVAPFLVVLYIYECRNNEQMVDVYEDLLNDNDMSMPVTYIYYIFNYYRKIFFAISLASTIPGLVQIYSLMAFNVTHLAFQIYLIVCEVYRSKSKVVIKFISSVCIIVLQVLIVIYNVNNYSNQANVNIGMSCFYIAIATAILGIIDAVIKIVDTIQQEVDGKKVKPAKPTNDHISKPILKQFRKQIRCNLGEEITHKPKDPKQLKFKMDKELMENTIRPKEEREESSQGVSDRDKPDGQAVDLVYIDDQWMNVYPEKKEISPELIFQFEEEDDAEREKKQQPMRVEMYSIPPQISRQAMKISKTRMKRSLKRKSSKYQVPQEPSYQFLASKSSNRARIHDNKNHMQVRPINESQEEISEYDPNQ